MYKTKTLLFSFFLCLIVTSSLTAQDKHFSLYNLSPLRLNPANTGAFEGTVRLSGIFRDQYASLIGNEYTTPSISADSPILMVGKRNWLGVGAMFLSDNVGAGNLKDTYSMLSAAFHYSMDKKSKTIITFGVQGGNISRSVSNRLSTDGGFEFADELPSSQGGGGVASSPLRNSLLQGSGMEDGSVSGIDVAAGVLLTNKINKETTLKLGVSFLNILRSNYSVLNQSGGGGGGNANRPADQRRPVLTALHGTYTREMSDNFRIEPSFLAQTIKGSPLELVVQGMGGLHMNETKDITVNFGLGYRVGDAAEVLLGMDYKALRVGASYDITLSDLQQADGFQSGFEIGAWYIIKIFKKPDVKPAILCPQL